MTLHPHHLHAYTALCALARSWPLARTAAGHTTTTASDGIRSTTYGRTSPGTHSDGGMLRAIEAGHDEQHRWGQLLDRIAADVWDALALAQACTTLRRTRGGPLAVLARALPATQPHYARDIATALHGADKAARAALQLDPDRMPMTGVPCPHCDVRLLEACTTSPHRAAWTVLCGSCSGIWRWTWLAAWDRDRLAAIAEASRLKAEAEKTARSSTSTTPIAA